MHIKYVARSLSRESSFFGSGTVSSFGIGLSTTSHAGTFTNTDSDDVEGPVFVVAALTQKHADTIARFDDFAKGKDVPVNCFFFIPSVATATWHIMSDNTTVWASLPKFTLKAGKSYKGYYVPLSALPPFGSRAEVGTVDTKRVDVHIKDYFLTSAAYFYSDDTEYTQRLDHGSTVINVDGGNGDKYTDTDVLVQNSNVSITFSDLLYKAVDDGTPAMTVRVSGVKSVDHGLFMPTIELNTSELPKHSKISIPEEKGDTAGRHGIDTIGNSGFTNNRNIPLDGFLTKIKIPTNIKVVHVGVKTRTVAGIDYMSGGYKRVNVYLAK